MLQVRKIFKKRKKYGEGVEKRECSCTVGGNVDWHPTMEEGVEMP